MRSTHKFGLAGALALVLAVAVVAANASSSRPTEQAAASAPNGAAALASKASCNSLKKKTTGATIAYMPPGLEFPYYIGIGQGVKQFAKKYRYKVFTSSPVSGADYAGQASRMRDVIHRGVDGIIFHTHNNSATAPLVKQAVAAGIAVVIVNQD